MLPAEPEPLEIDPGRTAVIVVDMLEAIYKSAATGKLVTIGARG